MRRGARRDSVWRASCRPVQPLRRQRRIRFRSSNPRFASKAFNWWASQDEQFNSPIVRGIARTKLYDLSRHRALTADEIRQVWKAFDGFRPEAYGRMATL